MQLQLQKQTQTQANSQDDSRQQTAEELSIGQVNYNSTINREFWICDYGYLRKSISPQLLLTPDGTPFCLFYCDPGGIILAVCCKVRLV
jgi:hypothetical protein